MREGERGGGEVEGGAAMKGVEFEKGAGRCFPSRLCLFADCYCHPLLIFFMPLFTLLTVS